MSNSPKRWIDLGFDQTPHPAGTHVCFIFSDDDMQRQVMARYVESGLDGHERVGYFVDSLSPTDLKTQLRALGVSLPDEMDGWQYRILDAGQVYCPDGCFDVHRMLGTLADAHHGAIRDGFHGARVTGEMSWSLRGFPGSENLVEYEARINLLVREVPTTAICQYDARLFDGAMLHRILSVHPLMIVRGQIVSNPYYLEPEEVLDRLGPPLRRST